MPFTLRVVFEGVCALVPSETLFRHGRPTETLDQLSVLLPDLRLPDLAYWDRDPRAPSANWRAPHLAFLDVEADCLMADTDAEVQHDWIDPETRRRRLAFYFDQRRLFVEGGTGDPLTVEQARCSGAKPSTLQEERSLWWLPRLSEVAPDSEWFQGSAQQCERGELPGLVGGVFLREGHVATRGFNRNLEDGEIQVWPFGPVARGADGELALPEAGRSSWNRAIANRIVWELTIRDSARLVFVDAADERRSVLLRPPMGSGRAPVEVRVANVEPEVALLGAAPFFGALRELLPDPDFQAFYRFGGDNGSDAATRWAVPLAPGNVQGQNEKPCAPALYSGFSEDGG
ncbi:MAG: hypothetical protein SF066_22330 [Thermoanaerobaculia bacterium]|nr:hypothetical protein [Thermoanaerobaculia bacterium]